MKNIFLFAGYVFLFGCNSKNMNASQQRLGVNYKWLDSIRQSGDTFYVKKYGTTRFAKAEYFVSRKDAVICQVMKDTADTIRQIIVTKNNRRNFFAEYYPNGQLMAQLPLDSFGQNNGDSKYFYLNGSVESEGIYKNNLKTGIWKNYDAGGKLLSTNKYDSNGQALNINPQQ